MHMNSTKTQTSHQIAPSLAEQFDRVWRTLRSALSRLDEDQFHAGDVDFLIPRNLAYHTIETADFYSSDGPPDAFPWGYFKAESKAEMLRYADEVQSKVRRWCTAQDDEQWLKEQSQWKWTGRTMLDRALYTLRHTQHHTAQINAELRRRGLPRGEWH
jgi:uncharacterized damage-inducible protein DinB